MKPVNFIKEAPTAAQHKAINRWSFLTITGTTLALTVILIMHCHCWYRCKQTAHHKHTLAREVEPLERLIQEQQTLAAQEKKLKKIVMKLSRSSSGNYNPTSFLTHIKNSLGTHAYIETICCKKKNIELRLLPTSHESLTKVVDALTHHELCTNLHMSELSQKDKKIIATLKSSPAAHFLK